MSPSLRKTATPFVSRLYNSLKKNKPEPIPSPESEKKKNLILFVGAVYGHMIDAIAEHEAKTGTTYRIGLIYPTKEKLDEYTQSHLGRLDLVLSCDINSDMALQRTLAPYQDDILVITCRPEKFIPALTKIIPHVPYTETPTIQSLMWTTDKFSMRERIQNYDPTINPKYAIITKNTKQSIKEVIDYIGFPLIVKPSGLAASRLVSICYHKEELDETLKNIFKKLQGVHKETGGTWESKILIEQFMDGNMYSMDVYVSETGKLYFCPLIYIKTGRAIGFDDFFGYQQMTAAKLNADAIHAAEQAATTAIRAMALRSTTVHIEFIRMEEGWKIIEMGPRAGGFRHMMYAYSHGINHTMNDILIRAKKKPNLPKTQLGWSVAMKFFGKTEGKLKALNGIKKTKELSSFKVMYVHKKVGDSCTYAKHGGSSVFDIIMFNKDRSELLADIRRLEKMIEIVVE